MAPIPPSRGTRRTGASRGDGAALGTVGGPTAREVDAGGTGTASRGAETELVEAPADGTATGAGTGTAPSPDAASGASAPAGPATTSRELPEGTGGDPSSRVAEAELRRPWPFTRAAPTNGAPWTRMLFIGVICFALWLLLDAPSLQRSAIVSPLGTRRTVSLDVVGPIAALSRGLGLSHVVGWTDDVLGRTPGGGPTLAKRLHPLPPGRRTATPGTGPAGPPAPTVPPLNLHPTAADPLRVLVIGDSIGIDLGQPLVADLSATGVANATLDGQIDTGLSRPDYFNWPAELAIDLANDRPQLVVVMMGANDPQSLVGPDGSTPYGAPGWTSEYGQRVGTLIGEAKTAGAHVVWVGMPPMARPDLNSGMQLLNSVVESQIATDPDATFVSSVGVLGDGNGNFAAYLPDSSGAEVNVRTPDGIHLAPGGGERLSQAVLAALRTKLHIDLPG